MIDITSSKTSYEISWSTPSGRFVLVKVGDYLDQATATAFVDGAYRSCVNAPAKLIAPVKIGDEDVVAGLGKVALTQERYDIIVDLLASKQAEIDARPEVRKRKLVARRDVLVSRIGHILDAEHAANERYVRDVSEHGFAARSSIDFKALESSARSELMRFDAAHPEALENAR